MTTPQLQPQDSPGHPMVDYFAGWRAERAAARGAPRPRRRAVITIVHNEPVFLPIWLSYYSRFFAAEDIYVLDNDTSDGSTDRAGFVRIPVTHDTVDHTWMVRTIESLQHELLDSYEVVLVTDVDEIVAPVPEFGTLGDYIDRFEEEWVNCLGYELLHMREREPSFRTEEPVLDQRGWWFANDGYDKASLATAPMSWRPGFHGRSDFHCNWDPDLRLIHLHRMDFELCRQRHEIRRRRRWADHDQEQEWATHNQIVDEAEFAHWFYEDSCFEGIQISPEQIAANWKGTF